MATTAVELLLGKIVGALENEAALIRGIRGELEDLQKEIPCMQSFLEDAERKRSKVAMTEGEKQWVKDVRATAFIAEDLIDEFMYHMNRQQRGGRLRKFLNWAIRTPKILWVKHRIGKQLQDVKKMVRDIPERRQRYVIEPMQQETRSMMEHYQSWARKQGESSLFFKDTDLVGIEEDGELLVGWLTADNDSQLSVISVVGMGGSGKTTLAAKAYNSQNVKRCFDCYAWITVSQTYEVDDLLRSMVKEFHLARKEPVPVDLSSKTYRELVDMLVSYLGPKKYAMVLDDVWDHNLWNDIRVALPSEGGRGSRVLLTTRREDIACSSFGVRSHIHRLKPLYMTEAWKLFCIKAFSSNPNTSCPPELKALGWELVARCDGLPLAIVALGGIMSSKKLKSEWTIVYDRFNWELSNNPELDRVKQILWMSFENLPHRLKFCFLYCCLFPEDYMIRRKRLIRLWMAEGFVQNVTGITAEEVAEGYLMELTRRSMLQVVKRNPSGRPKACKMHDLMRDLAIWRSNEENFGTLYHGGNTNEQDGARRLSIQTLDDVRELKSNSWKGMSTLRSLFIFHKRTYDTSPALEMLNRFRLLRVLDLQDSPIEELSNEVGKLFNLRYLNLRRTDVKELPKSIGNLVNLQTLITAESQIQVLPSEITKLHSLRHLITYRYNDGNPDHLEYCYGTPVPFTICDELKNLQVLAYVEADAGFIKKVRKMTQLTRIGFTKVTEADQENLCSSIADMRLLRYLLVMVSDEEDYLRMDGLLSAPPRLQTLILAGKLDKVPRWFRSLGNLTTLYLEWSRLSEEEDPLPHIQALPNLGRLDLTNAYVGTKLCFAIGFHKLTRLSFNNFSQLNEIVIAKGVMPGLQTMELYKCSELKILPLGIEYLSHLQQLHLMSASNELIERIRGEGSVDRPKVRHIPEIGHYYPDPSGLQLYESLS